MKTLLLLASLLLGFSGTSIAAPRQWKEATVAKFVVSDGGNQTVLMPLFGSIYGASVPINRGSYWIQTEDMTFVVTNFANGMGSWSHRTILLTVGGKVKVSLDGKNLRLIDEEGHERSVPILEKVAKN